jgi:hypothetical protein
MRTMTEARWWWRKNERLLSLGAALALAELVTREYSIVGALLGTVAKALEGVRPF